MALKPKQKKNLKKAGKWTIVFFIVKGIITTTLIVLGAGQLIKCGGG